MLITLLGLSKRYSARPSSLLDISDPYEAYCLDEACLFVQCRIEQDGRLPRKLEKMTEPLSNADTVRQLTRYGGVTPIDLRRNDSLISDDRIVGI